jgi:hypothetical protein
MDHSVALRLNGELLCSDCAGDTEPIVVVDLAAERSEQLAKRQQRKAMANG